MGRPTAGWGSINCAGEFLRFHQPENPQELSRTHSISYMGRPTAGWGSINCAGAGQPGRVWQARTAPGVAMLPGEAGINVRKTARYAGKDCDPLQLDLFAEQVCEVEADGVRYVLRNNPEETRRIEHRLEDKLAKLRSKIDRKSTRVEKSSRCKPEAGLAMLKRWMSQHKLANIVELKLQERQIVESVNEEAKRKSLELAGCYVLVSDVGKETLSTEQIHDSYMALQKVERDFRTMK